VQEDDVLRPEALPFADDRDLPPVRFLEPLRVLLAEPGDGRVEIAVVEE